MLLLCYLRSTEPPRATAGMNSNQLHIYTQKTSACEQRINCCTVHFLKCFFFNCEQVLVPEYVWTMLHPSAKDALTVTGVVLSVALLHVTYRQMSSAFASSRNSRADILGTCYRATHGAASLCVLLYWSIKYDHAWAADALFPNSVRQAALYLYTAAASVLHGHSVDWLLVLPRAVLTLCAATCASVIVSLLYMRCFAHSHIDSTQFQYVQLVHLCGSVAVVVCLLMGPAGCLPLAACVLHSVLYVRSFCSMLPLTGVNLFDTNTYVLADQQSSPKSTYSTPRSTGESAQCPQQRWLIRTLLQLSLALYFPVMGRFLYFLTGHRMDFGTLQVRNLISNALFIVYCLMFFVYCLPQQRRLTAHRT